MTIMDQGKWRVQRTGDLVWLMSEDFTHDAMLRVYGDFTDAAQCVQYAEQLAERLNQLPTGDTK